jgi:hypothetical protein
MLTVPFLKAYIKAIERYMIDAQFEDRAIDTDYRRLMLRIEAEFAQSDWEVLQLDEAEQLTKHIGYDML